MTLPTLMAPHHPPGCLPHHRPSPLLLRCDSYALAIVSHDREFLDRVCTKIVETEQGVAYSYNGNCAPPCKGSNATPL